MNPISRAAVNRSRAAVVGAALAFTALFAPAAVVAADAPNTCAAATSASAGNTWLTDTISSSTDTDWFRFDLASSARTLITLGNLPRDYDLYLYSSCSTLLAS